VRRFVFTADHGFLLVDEHSRKPQPHGRKIDPQRRHVVSQIAADHPDEVRVALAELGYEGADGYLMFPASTAVFDRGKRDGSFVHGGNSLQERVIPVLTVTHDMGAKFAPERYVIRATAEDPVAGMHCLTLGVELEANGALTFGAAQEIEIGLRARGADGVLVELCQVRGPARLAGGAIHATVGASFEVFFRLSGGSEERAAIEVYHPSKSYAVEPCTPARFYDVTQTRPAQATDAPARPRSDDKDAWLERLPEGGVRQLFEHLAAHGAVTEPEAVKILGSPRAARSFAIEFEKLAPMVPFGIHIDVVGGVKRYTREGSQP
jgi:hypothetical protein